MFIFELLDFSLSLERLLPYCGVIIEILLPFESKNEPDFLSPKKMFLLFYSNFSNKSEDSDCS